MTIFRPFALLNFPFNLAKGKTCHNTINCVTAAAKLIYQIDRENTPEPKKLERKRKSISCQF